MEIINPKIEKYLSNLIPERDSVLKEMEKIAEKKDFPIVGPLVCQFLFQYTKLLNPKRILELGSGYGYSAVWFARGSSESTKIYCTDGSEENEKKAEKFFKQAGILEKIEFYVGDALTTMKKLEGEFDLIFCDIDKESYPRAFSESIPRLRSGGIMITDNTLWHGRIIDENPESESTKGVKKFNELAFTDSRVISMIIPIRDGVCITYKL